MRSAPARWIVTLLAIVLVALFVLRWWQSTSEYTEAETLVTTLPSSPAAVSSRAPVAPEATSQTLLTVDVVGAVQQPGVYQLPAGARLFAAIDAAGGFAPTADRDRVNLAALLNDGDQVRVPSVGETAAAGSAPTGSAPAAVPSGLVNINTADAKTLETLDGIGPATAQRIVQYRETNGPFASLDELLNVERIGPSTLNKFRNQVTLGP